MMKKCFCLIFALGFNLLAADVTGTWKGTASQDDDGRKIGHPLSIKLVQTGAKVTGATFTDSGQSLPLEGDVEGSRIRLQLKTASELITFEMSLEGNHLKGKLTSQHGDESQTSTLDLTKAGS